MHSTFSKRSPFLKLRLFNAATAMAVAASAVASSASAANLDADSLLRLPAASAEVSSELAVVASVPFNRFVNLATCNSNGTACNTRLPRLAANMRWVIQFVSCTADVNEASTFRNFSLQVTNATVTKLTGFHFVAPTYQSNHENHVTVHVASQPIVITVEPNSYLYMFATSIGGIGGAQCAISGVQQKLG